MGVRSAGKDLRPPKHEVSRVPCRFLLPEYCRWLLYKTARNANHHYTSGLQLDETTAQLTPT